MTYLLSFPPLSILKPSLTSAGSRGEEGSPKHCGGQKGDTGSWVAERGGTGTLTALTGTYPFPPAAGDCWWEGEEKRELSAAAGGKWISTSKSKTVYSSPIHDRQVADT